MKIILTGATGFVGGEVLAQLIASPTVTQVTCLTRREITVYSPKVTTILHSDFSSCDPTLLDRFTDHSACIWALDGKASDLERLLCVRGSRTHSLWLWLKT